MNIVKLLKVTSVLEILVGLALIFIPSAVIQILIGAAVTDVIETIGRLTGIVFLSFGISCWQGKGSESEKINMSVVTGMFAYNLIVSVFFFYLKFAGGYNGLLLLPAAILHLIITLCFIYLLFIARK